MWVGIGITLLATSLTYFVYRLVLPEVTSPPRIETPFGHLPFPYLFGHSAGRVSALFNQTPLTYLAFHHRGPRGLGCSTARRWGSPVRAAGENPAAVWEATGHVGHRHPHEAPLMVGSALMAVGGAFPDHVGLLLLLLRVVNGRGWVCIALVVFGSWRPGKALLGAILFAAFDALPDPAPAGGGRHTLPAVS